MCLSFDTAPFFLKWRDRERLTFNFPIHYQYLTKSLCSYDTE